MLVMLCNVVSFQP